MARGNLALRLLGSVALVGLGFAIGLALKGRFPRPGASPSDDARLSSVIAHERAKGNGVVEADVRAGGSASVDLPQGTFAVFAAPAGSNVNRLTLDGGPAGAVALVRLAKDSLPYAGLSSRWNGRLTLRLTQGGAAHLAFFAAPAPLRSGPTK